MLNSPAVRFGLVALAASLAAPPASATPLQIFGVWHAGNDACIWGSVRDLTEFDQKNHWIIDRGDGIPSVNLAILSFVQPLKLLNKTNDSQTQNGVPVGMTPDIVNYFTSHGVRVMLSIGGITYVTPWDQALAANPAQLGRNAAEVARRLGVGIEIDYEGSSSTSISGLAAFIDAYRSMIPYDATGADPAARLTIDLASGDRWLIALTAKATRDWLDPMDPVLDYANAMVPARQPSASSAQSNWQEHVDGNSRMSPPIPPLAPAKMTGSLFLTGRGVSAECSAFGQSVTYAIRDYVQNVPPNGAGVTPGMLGYMFWAAECEGTKTTCTTPPNTCEGGLGAGAKFFNIPVPMPPLRQDHPLVDAPPPAPGSFALYGSAPNPLTHTTVFGFKLPEPSRVDLRVYDAAGREVALVAAGDFPAGVRSIPWIAVGHAGQPLRAGTYLYRMRAVSASKHVFERTLRMTILR